MSWSCGGSPKESHPLRFEKSDNGRERERKREREREREIERKRFINSDVMNNNSLRTTTSFVLLNTSPMDIQQSLYILNG